jgi:DNA-binding transcriptional LysR family regulator
MDVDFSQLNYFRVVAKLEHMTKAAELLNISQPALSIAISRLEERIGHSLFHRGPNSIRLNANGQIFLRYVERIFAEMNAGLNELENLNGEEFGQIRYATYGPGMGLDVEYEYLLTHSNISMTHEILSPEEMVEQLENGELDFAISMEELHGEHIEWTPLYQERLEVLVSHLHPLSKQPELNITDISHERFAVMSADRHCCSRFYSICKRAGFLPDIFYSGSDIFLINFLVANNLCLFVVTSDNNRYARMDPSRRFTKGNYVSIPLSAPNNKVTVGIAQHQNHKMSLAAQSFREHFLTSITSLERAKP